MQLQLQINFRHLFDRVGRSGIGNLPLRSRENYSSRPSMTNLFSLKSMLNRSESKK